MLNFRTPKHKRDPLLVREDPIPKYRTNSSLASFERLTNVPKKDDRIFSRKKVIRQPGLDGPEGPFGSNDTDTVTQKNHHQHASDNLFVLFHDDFPPRYTVCKEGTCPPECVKTTCVDTNCNISYRIQAGALYFESSCNKFVLNGARPESRSEISSHASPAEMSSSSPLGDYQQQS